MTEPDVALTDYAVALECALFVVLLYRRVFCGRLGTWCMLFFGAMSVASLLGGTVHGFFLDGQNLGHRILWPGTMLATGVATFSIWAIGATILFSKRVARWVVIAAAAELTLYGFAVLLLTQAFWTGIVNSLPAVLFLLVALVLAYRREKRRSLLLAAGAMVLALIAALLQQLRIGIDPVYFNHNALYHALQAVALLLFFLATGDLSSWVRPALERSKVDSLVVAGNQQAILERPLGRA